MELMILHGALYVITCLVLLDVSVDKKMFIITKGEWTRIYVYEYSHITCVLMFQPPI